MAVAVEPTGPPQIGHGRKRQYVYWITMSHPLEETVQRLGLLVPESFSRGQFNEFVVWPPTAHPKDPWGPSTSLSGPRLVTWGGVLEWGSCAKCFVHRNNYPQLPHHYLARCVLCSQESYLATGSCWGSCWGSCCLNNYPAG